MNVVDRVGTYGGNWHSALVGGSDDPWLLRTMTYENLMRWSPDWSQVVPNIAESVDVSPDAKDYTFHLRKGMKWSDGAPFTSDDIAFWYQDLLLNKEFTPTPAEPFINTDGTPVAFTKLDETTFKFSFKKPKGLFLQFLATARPQDNASVRYPAHYLKKYHPTYNPDGIKQELAAAKQQNWVGMLNAKAIMWGNPDLPTINAWTITQGYGSGSATRVAAKRNPSIGRLIRRGTNFPISIRVHSM